MMLFRLRYLKLMPRSLLSPSQQLSSLKRPIDLND